MKKSFLPQSFKLYRNNTLYIITATSKQSAISKLNSQLSTPSYKQSSSSVRPVSKFKPTQLPTQILIRLLQYTGIIIFAFIVIKYIKFILLQS